MAKIDPTAIVSPQSKIPDDCIIGAWTWIGPKVRLGPGCIIGPRVTIDGDTILGKNCQLSTGAVIGSPPQDLKYKGENSLVRIGDNCVIREFVTINRATGEGCATQIGNNCFIMAYAHIAHNCELEDNVIMANVATLGGHIHIGRGAIIGGIVAIHQFCQVGRYSIIGGSSGIGKDIIPYITASGTPARPYGLNRVGLKRKGFSRQRISNIYQAYKIIFRSGLTEMQAVERLKQEFPGNEDIEYIIRFIEKSQRGLAR